MLDLRRAALQARLQQHQRGVHRLAEAGLAVVIGTAGEGAQAGGDLAHAVDQLADGLQVAAGHVEGAALEEAHGVAGQGAQRRQRLVEFVGDAGGHLPDHRQLAGLDQFVLGLAQVRLGLPALADLRLEPLVAGREVGGAFGDAPLQLVVGPLQRLARGQAGGDHLAPLVQRQAEEDQQRAGAGGQQGVADGRAALVLQRGQQGQAPGRVVQRPALLQVVDPPRRSPVRRGAGVADLLDAVAQRRARQRLQFLQRPPVVLQAARQALAGVRPQRPHRLEPPRRVAGEDDDAVLVADVGLQPRPLPALLEGVQAHLDHRHADDPLALAQAVGQVVAGLAGGAADAVEAPRLALHGVLEIGAERQVLAEEAARLAPVAGGQHPPGGVQHVGGQAAAAAVEALEVIVDPLPPVVAGRLQQAPHVFVELEQAGQVVVLGDLAFHRAGVQLQLALAVLGQGADARPFAEAVAGIAAAEHQREQQQGQQQVAEQARFHGQGRRHGAEAGGWALHHSHPVLASSAGRAQTVGGAGRRTALAAMLLQPGPANRR
ncbi:hypothetical protein D3C85_898920 [compost metagenome]